MSAGVPNELRERGKQYAIACLVSKLDFRPDPGAVFRNCDVEADHLGGVASLLKRSKRSATQG
jgi:hypothetical protein